MSQAEHDALLRAVCANPGDDAQRLVYADWLEEHGKVERAEFIRVQVELARIDESDERFDALNERQLELLRAHGKVWDQEALQGVNGFTLRDMWDQAVYRRGFPARVYARTIQALLAGAAALFERIPAEECLLYWCYDDELEGGIAELMASPHAARLTGLKTQGRGYALDSLNHFFHSPLAPRIEQIDTQDCDHYGVRIAQQIAQAPGLTGLRSLDLAGNQIENAGLGLLATAPHLASLRALSLGVDAGEATNDLSAPGLGALSRSPNLRLERLDLNGNDTLGSEGILALFRSPGVASLRELNLSRCGVDDGGIIALAASRHAAGLRRLNLSGNVLTDVSARELARSKYLGNLVRLDLDEDGAITPAGHRLLRERFGRRVKWLSAAE